MKKMIYAVISLIMIVVFGGMSFAADNCCCEDENGNSYCLEGNPDFKQNYGTNMFGKNRLFQIWRKNSKEVRNGLNNN